MSEKPDPDPSATSPIPLDYQIPPTRRLSWADPLPLWIFGIAMLVTGIPMILPASGYPDAFAGIIFVLIGGSLVGFWMWRRRWHEHGKNRSRVGVPAHRERYRRDSETVGEYTHPTSTEIPPAPIEYFRPKLRRENWNDLFHIWGTGVALLMFGILMMIARLLVRQNAEIDFEVLFSFVAAVLGLSFLGFWWYKRGH